MRHFQMVGEQTKLSGLARQAFHGASHPKEN